MNTLHQNSLVIKNITLNLHVKENFPNIFLFLKTLPFKALALNAFKEKWGHI
jgi:hypothetical protein